MKETAQKLLQLLNTSSWDPVVQASELGDSLNAAEREALDGELRQALGLVGAVELTDDGETIGPDGLYSCELIVVAACIKANYWDSNMGLYCYVPRSWSGRNKTSKDYIPDPTANIPEEAAGDFGENWEEGFPQAWLGRAFEGFNPGCCTVTLNQETLSSEAVRQTLLGLCLFADVDFQGNMITMNASDHRRDFENQRREWIDSISRYGSI